MRQVETRHLDLRTGILRITTRWADDAPMDQRFAELRAGLPDWVGGVLTAAVQCDGCGAVEQVNAALPELPQGWVTERDGEFCPSCLDER